MHRSREFEFPDRPHRMRSEWELPAQQPEHSGRKRSRLDSDVWDEQEERQRHHREDYRRRELEEGQVGMLSEPSPVYRTEYLSERREVSLFEPFVRSPLKSSKGRDDVHQFGPLRHNRERGEDGRSFEPMRRERVEDGHPFEPVRHNRERVGDDSVSFEPFMTTERGRHGEEYLPLEQHSSPLPSLRSTIHSPSLCSLEVHEDTIDHGGYEENHFVGSRGNKGRSITPKKQKASVSSRRPSGKSVWDRIEELPPIMRSPSPCIPSPSAAGNLLLETDTLSMLYKSNALVAKVVEDKAVESSNPVALSSEEKAPAALIPIVKKKKIIKRKVTKKRTRVVIPVVTSSKSPPSLKGTQMAPVLTSLPHGSGQLEISPEVSVPSGKSSSTVSRQPCMKTTVKTTLVGKKKASLPAKKTVITEVAPAGDALGEDKPVAGNEESKKYADALLSEISSQLFHQGSYMAVETTVNLDGEQSGKSGQLVRDGDVKDVREVECITPDGKPGAVCGVPVSSVMEVDDQEAVVVTASVKNIVCQRPCLVETEVNVEHEEPSRQTGKDALNTTDSDIGLSLLPIKVSPMSFSGDKAQPEMTCGSVTFSGTDHSPKGKRGKKKRKETEKHQNLATEEVTENFEALLGGQSELGDPCFDSHMHGTTVVEAEKEDASHTKIPLVGPKDDDDNGLHLQVTNECVSGYTKLGQENLEVSRIDSMDERMDQTMPSKHAKVDHLMAVPKVQDLLHLTTARQSVHKGTGNKSYVKNQDNLPPNSLFASEGKYSESNKSQPVHLPQKIQAKPILAEKKVADEEPVRKINATSGVPRTLPTRVVIAAQAKGSVRSTHSLRNKTWHRDIPTPRTGSQGNSQVPGSSSMHELSQKKTGRSPNSYIRKGNSLVRNPAAEVHPLKKVHDLGFSNNTSRHAMNNSTGEIKVERKDSVIVSNPPFERPRTPPLPSIPKLTNSSMNLPNELSRPMLEHPNSGAGVQTHMGQVENQAIDSLSTTMENQKIIFGIKSEPSKTKNMVYVKHKSNQLIAAPRSDVNDPRAHANDNTQNPASSTSDHYYRPKKNQLVRNASTPDLQQKQNGIGSFVNSISDDQRVSTVDAMKHNRSTKFMKRLDKVLLKTYRHQKCSLVWTLSGENSHKKGATSSSRLKVLPYLFPWKRTIYRRNSDCNPVPNPRHSLSLFSRKLQHTRKRNTIYKVSTDGFSLRKTGVVSIGGASLKWSKSIEKHSRKASKEATLAVAEVERKRRETKTSVGAKGKDRRLLPRERIFRVGSARYKMDSSKRTLVRIPEQSSAVVDLKSRKNSGTTFVPRRLLIGNNEYIRIGNGHKLVRDPKQLVRMLASEKVRWSLHTARLRLAKKQQFCQFFTRFGQCNKGGGKCPYIHDPAKIAICTKFIRGLCTVTDCKLTHKVLPERMPDCSYFLQALCTNVNCPYRHVHVNPKAPVCDGFLKGYCADGDECRKKHSYACPSFEATGKCPQGSKCKLHHPKKKKKSQKQKLPVVQSYSHGRYFGSSVLQAGAEPVIAAPDKHDMEIARDIFSSDGHFPDYIPLGTGTDDYFDVDVPMDAQQTPYISEHSEMQQFDLDELIKPILIMKTTTSENPSAGP